MEIGAVNTGLYDSFNNGVYRAGFAITQPAYIKAVSDVFASLDYIERRLETRSFLAGNQPTEADVCAFVTLVRFERADYGLFKTNLKCWHDYPDFRSYLQRIYDPPGIAETVSPGPIKAGYYSIRALNPAGIVPAGPATPW